MDKVPPDGDAVDEVDVDGCVEQSVVIGDANDDEVVDNNCFGFAFSFCSFASHCVVLFFLATRLVVVVVMMITIMWRMKKNRLNSKSR